jgi:serralysin
VSNLFFGNLLLDGNLGDWTAFDRLDFVPETRRDGYEIYGKYTNDTYLFALKSEGQPIGLNTTFWLNTDANANTGFKIFGYAGGVEYFVNFNNNGTTVVPVLYQIDVNGNTVGEGKVLDFAANADGTAVEFAIPKALLNNISQKIDILVDVNDNTFLPSDYSSSPYTLETNLPQRTDFSKKVAIVFSETTANNFFDKKAYTQLFMSMQYQAMMAGVPFDILTEDDLTDLNKVVNYDALIFPSFRNVQSSKLEAISDTLTQAVYKYNIGIITAGDFLSNDETGAALAGDSYSRMKQLLDVTRTTGGGPVNGTLKAEDITHPMMDKYTVDETIRSYNNIFFNTYGDGISGDGKSPVTLADFEVGAQNYNAILATQTGGRNVHFATESFLGDNNLVWQALQWVLYDNKPTVRLNMSRDASIFLSRNDMDQSQENYQVNPDDGSQGIYAKMNPIVEKWKNDYNFVGSYYINIGNNPTEGRYTDWNLSRVYYNQLLALGNEIGTHSYTHLLDYTIPNDTNALTPQQLEFEFNQSKTIIEQQLGIKIVGAAVPGQPEGLYVNEELRKYLPYVTGGYSSVGAGYPGAFGFMFPGDDYVYFAPNMSFDFSLIGFKKLTAQQAELIWEQEYKEIIDNAAQPIVLFPWHDYGPTLTEPGYTEAMYTNFIARAYNDNTEFVTFADLYQRIVTFEQSQLFINQNGNTITAKVASNDVGKFGLNIDSNLPIQSVNNWYAYDKDTVFLPKVGGEFTINLGTTQDDVTHITDLPMRGELLSLTGNGSDLAFSFFGEGKVVIDLKAANGNNYLVEGADSKTLNGEILELKFNTVKQHNATVKLVADNPPTVVNPIANFSINEDAPNTIIDLSNVFADFDGTAIVKTVLVNSNGELVTTNLVGNSLTLDYQKQQFGTADITIRGTSGGKTVDDTFTVTVNTKGKITNGTNANNTLEGSAGRDIIYGLGGNDKLHGRSGNDNLYGGQGSDQLKGNDGNDFLYGEAGNDNLDGGLGFDVLIGVDRNSALAGLGEVDILKGGSNGDRFFLGDATRAYYNDGNNSNSGLSDYALIEDFSSSQGDVIQLHGNISNYKLSSVAGDTAIFMKTSGVDELIGIVDKTSNLNLNSSAFSFVS